MTLAQLLAAAVAPRAITATVNAIAYTWPADEWDVIPDGAESRIVRWIDRYYGEADVLYLAEIDQLEIHDADSGHGPRPRAEPGVTYDDDLPFE